jgi:hypothetical protein
MIYSSPTNLLMMQVGAIAKLFHGGRRHWTVGASIHDYVKKERMESVSSPTSPWPPIRDPKKPYPTYSSLCCAR